ncbi:polyprenyl synthetase family protein [Aequorivita viscosa]|uniref:Geranylgeranyl diphosphate synthase, type II n=1 Tax=Aequorivita viscosa TaxID=797419 RepID=A0A1M6C400_9FLAO|nr:polyprenyl synthetase family protein [Aequorivita viscosa]SDW23190.1 geranylgeranyl diphosphate synthase, type II [Aequorivita viscosa]SHI55531.1 geranylgeranyl diphosphate synthase, type II [Aequorivita viscosa]
MEVLKKYNTVLAQHLEKAVSKDEPKQLYDPIKYILSIGGKRVRPALTLLVCDFFDTDFNKAIPAALAVELFHNFSLIHDDIMDDSPLRRGKQTVHEKWDVNTGILSGDAMLILAYRFFEEYEPAIFKELAELFSETALQVCEGQQLDIDFETRDSVQISEYLKMIEQKTAVLLGAAMQMGAIVANASKKDKETMYEFGKNLGIAFQLQDDYLDVFGNPETFGKQVGGDIISNKKTFLYLMAEKRSTPSQAEELTHLFSINPTDPADKIKTVREIFIASKTAEDTRLEIEKYSNLAYSVLYEVNISEDKKELLRQFGKKLMERDV